MTFLTSYRAEKIYFEKLRSNIDIAKSYIQRGATDEVMALLQNAVDADGAIMLCYRNLGEVWADLAAQLEKTQKALEDLKTALEEYHDDLNKKIDEINNYLVRLINALDERVTILENESKVKFAYLNYDSVEDVYSIEYNGETADFDALSAALEYPHLLVLIDSDNGNIYYPRSVSDVLIDFHADGVSGSDYVDISVTITDSDVVAVTEKTVVNYTFGAGFNVSSTNEVTPDLTVLQAKLTAGTGIDIDPDTNEISADFNEVQEKLTSGFGIDIDANNEISVDTSDVQEKLIAGQNITLTPDSTDPTKTVIDAVGGGSSYTNGTGIYIDSNDVISAVQGYDIAESSGVLLEEKTGVEFYQQSGQSYEMKTTVQETFTVSKTDIETWLNTYKDFYLSMFKAGNATTWTYPTAQDFKTSDVRYSVELRYMNGATSHYYPISNCGHGMLYCGKTYLNTNTGVTYSATLNLREAMLKLYQTMLENNLNDITLNFVIIPKFIYNGSPQSTAMTSDLLGMISNFTLRVYGIK